MSQIIEIVQSQVGPLAEIVIDYTVVCYDFLVLIESSQAAN